MKIQKGTLGFIRFSCLAAAALLALSACSASVGDDLGAGGQPASARPRPGASSATTSSTTNMMTFNYTGGLQTWTVPDGVYQVSVQASGAGGIAGSSGGGSGGHGALVEGEMAVTPGEVWTIAVGGRGRLAKDGTYYVGGWGGFTGGNGTTEYQTDPADGAGGGATTMNNGQAIPPIVLGGGGGGGEGSAAPGFCDGGNGGEGGDAQTGPDPATNGGGGHCGGEAGGRAFNIAPGSKGGADGQSGGGGGGGAGVFGGGAGDSETIAIKADGGGAGGSSTAGPIQNTGIGQAQSVTDGVVIINW